MKNIEQQPARKNWKLMISLIILGAVCAVAIVFMGLRVVLEINKLVNREITHRKAVALGIFGATRETEERHVWIAEHAQGAGKDGDIPVHMMFRPSSNSVWQFCGTGTKLGKRPNCVLTAYHIFGGKSGQYGCRQIGPREFTGTEKIVPIVSCDYSGNADDAVLCAIDENQLSAPTLTVPESTNITDGSHMSLRGFRFVPAKVRLLTYADKEIQNLYWVEVRPGVFYFWLNCAVVRGESGTGAFFEEGRPSIYLVIIGNQSIPKEVFDHMPTQDKKIMGWSKDKLYGVGNLVFIDPRAP